MKNFLRTLAHAAISAGAVTATTMIYSGSPITSHNVLFPSLIAGALAAGHAAMPSTIGAGITQPTATTKTVTFPGTR